tara:strand:+ start:4736 stop:5389 length:654 start_codon:yes stop_codon:yes gene_type:complete
MTKKLKLGIMLSGRGTNFQALIDACKNPDFPAEISLVVSNQMSAEGLTRAREANIPCIAIPHIEFSNRELFENEISAKLKDAKVELVCLAGFMRILTTEFVKEWHNKIINIHPSLLPAFRGLDTHQRVLSEGVKISGCTVHYVRAEVDTGPIIVQAAVPVLPTDNEETLSERILFAEHKCYPLAVKLIASGDVVIEGNVVTFSGKYNCPDNLMNPTN